MIGTTLLLSGLMPFVAPAWPAPGLFRSRARVRRLDCERLTTETTLSRYPGEIAPEPPRGAYAEREVVRCHPRLLPPGVRAPRVEALLRDLERHASTVAGRVGSLGANGTARTWLVEAHDPDPQVVGKLRFALQNALLAQGLEVSDRTPRLGLADVDLITRLPPSQAYAAACRRYSENGSLGQDEALVALVNRDRRETGLHAGVCVDGGWRWLQ